MAEVSRRAAGASARGSLPNLILAVAAAEQPPAELLARADELTILFPWGSLLRGALALDERAAAGIAALLAPGGRATAFLSVTDRDAAALGVRPSDLEEDVALARRWAAHGLALASLRPATPDEVIVSGSTWGRRLTAGSGSGRPVWRLEIGCGPEPAGSSGPLDRRG